MRKHKETIILGITLILISVALHVLHYFLFRDTHHLFIFLVTDLAFIPLDVFFVSLILERVIRQQERHKTQRKIHMLVKMFYLELGNDLLEIFAKSDRCLTRTTKELLVDHTWSKNKYESIKNTVDKTICQVDIHKIDIADLKETLIEQKSLVVNLITNEMTLDHDEFSDALMATYHLHDVLLDVDVLHMKKTDYDRLTEDIQRCYEVLFMEWTHYMNHIATEYPYLYEKALESNPFMVEL